MSPWVNTIHRAALASRGWPTPLRYLATTLLVSFVTWLRATGGEGWERYPFLPYIPVIFACGVFLDRGNGFLATVLSVGMAAYFLLPPLHSFAIASGADQLALALFFAVGIVISAIVEALHKGLVELAIEHAAVSAVTADRRVLLDELSHRTRNDFTNIVTLLNLQARVASPEAKEALLSAADRVQSIARVHRRLEIVNERVVVDTKAYFNELCNDLRASRLALRPIAIECIAESYFVSLEKAVPLGLIVNESVTNAAKHAFPNDRQGTIQIRFQKTGGVYMLTITDDGVGRSDRAGGNGLGSKLMQMLAGQLGSTVEIEPRNPGSAVVLTIAIKSVQPVPNNTASYD